MKVIPANAGVILMVTGVKQEVNGYPRECGGDPEENADKAYDSELSPRMRG